MMLKNPLARRKVGDVGKAQIKIMAIIVHNTLLGVVGLAAITYFYTSDIYDESFNFIACQSTGRESCEVQGISSLDEILILAAVVILIALLPIVVILFTCDPKACRCRKQDRNSSRSSTKESQLSRNWGSRAGQNWGSRAGQNWGSRAGRSPSN